MTRDEIYEAIFRLEEWGYTAGDVLRFPEQYKIDFTEKQKKTLKWMFETALFASGLKAGVSLCGDNITEKLVVRVTEMTLELQFNLAFFHETEEIADVFERLETLTAIERQAYVTAMKSDKPLIGNIAHIVSKAAGMAVYKVRTMMRYLGAEKMPLVLMELQNGEKSVSTVLDAYSSFLKMQ